MWCCLKCFNGLLNFNLQYLSFYFGKDVWISKCKLDCNSMCSSANDCYHSIYMKCLIKMHLNAFRLKYFKSEPSKHIRIFQNNFLGCKCKVIILFYIAGHQWSLGRKTLRMWWRFWSLTAWREFIRWDDRPGSSGKTTSTQSRPSPWQHYKSSTIGFSLTLQRNMRSGMRFPIQCVFLKFGILDCSWSQTGHLIIKRVFFNFFCI